jgi:hypothetical protein
MVYQDHLTKFVVIRPLTSKRAAEVAYQLMDIFLLFGAPHILQSDNGSEFTAQIISDLKELWPELVIVHGKPRHPQSQGSVERANYDIKDMLVAWMSENDTADWTVGVKFVQFRKNSSFNAGIKQSPYATLFGIEARIGLTSSSLPHDVIQKLQTEDDLLAILSSSSTQPDTQPLPEMTPPLLETTQPLPETTQPLPETTQPLLETPQPLSETTQPLLETTQPTSSIDKKRKLAIAAQQKQAERVVKRSRVIMKDCTVGDNVAVPIPSVDRGRGDPRNILGVILAVENGQYTIGCPSGILKGK